MINCFYIYRKAGDSTLAIVQRLTETPHAPGHGTSEEPPDISNLESGGDRAYTLQPIVSYFVKGGARPFGTLKRDHWVPFSFGKKLPENDWRTDIPMHGGLNMFIKKTKIHNVDVFVVAYRDATNSVCLGITTDTGIFHWDLVARNPRDATWYFDPDNKDFMNTEDILKLKAGKCDKQTS